MVFLIRLIDWEFDESRQKVAKAMTKGENMRKRLSQKIDDRLFLHQEEIEDFGEFLYNFIPLFPEVIPSTVKEAYDVLGELISPASNGMGYGIRNSSNDIEEMLSRRGLSYDTYSPYVVYYENKMMNSLNKAEK